MSAIIYSIEIKRDVARSVCMVNNRLIQGKRQINSEALNLNQPLFIHCHIFKNAGTSLIESFRKAFQGNAIELEPDDPDSFLSFMQINHALDRNPDLIFISSHRVKLPLPRHINGRKIIPIIFFRDPIDRLGSVYRFEKKDARPTVYSALAKNSPMPVFFNTILGAGFDVIVSNVHADFCSISSDYNLDMAKKYLQNHVLMGLVEDSYFSMALIEKEVKKYYPEILLPVFKENVTRKESNVVSNVTKTIYEMGVGLAKKLIQKNSIDYQLYRFTCEELNKKWCLEENKKEYLNYCKNNNIESEFLSNRINIAPSLNHLGEAENKLIENDLGYEFKWVRYKNHKADSIYKPKVEAVKITSTNKLAALFEVGQDFCVEFKIRWQRELNFAAVGLTVRDHRNEEAFSLNSATQSCHNVKVDDDCSKSYCIKLVMPNIAPGLYRVDIHAGVGLNGQFSVFTTAEAVISFGVAPHAILDKNLDNLCAQFFSI